MPKKIKGFIMFYDWKPILESIPVKDFKKFTLALFDLAENGIEPPMFSKTTQLAGYAIFSAIRRYREASANGKKGAARSNAKSTHNDATDCDNDQPPVQGADITKQSTYENENNTSTVTNTITEFDAFWEAYPRKVGHKVAQEEWDKIAPDENLSKAIIDAVYAQKSTSQWRKDDGKYIPYPARWLAEHRWEDKLTDAANSNFSTFDANEFAEAAFRKSLERYEQMDDAE